MSDPKETVTVEGVPIDVARYWLGEVTTPPTALMHQGKDSLRTALEARSTKLERLREDQRQLNTALCAELEKNEALREALEHHSRHRSRCSFLWGEDYCNRGLGELLATSADGEEG